MIRTTIYYQYRPPKRSSLWRYFFSSFFGHTNHQKIYNNNNKNIIITRSIILYSCMKYNHGMNITTTTTLPIRKTTTTITTTTTESHYNQHNDESSYEDAYFYEPGLYMEYVKQLVQDRFQFQQHNQDEDTDAEINNDNESNLNNNKLPLNHTTMKPLVLLDIGGGTGTFTKLITKGSTIHSIVIDPFLEDIHNDAVVTAVDDDIKNEIKNNNDDHTTNDDNNLSNNNESIQFIKESAEVFIMNNNNDDDNNSNKNNNKWMKDYDYILLKEVVHHFRDIDRIPIFRGMYHGLNTVTYSSSSSNVQQDTCIFSTTSCSQEYQQNLRPSILIITRPQYDIDYPLWPEAKDVWSQNQPSVDSLVNDLLAAGFTNINTTIESYPCSISIHRWILMIQQRFWSTFSHFNDNELIIGCQYIKEHYKERIIMNNDDDIINFEDRLVFISASKV